MPIFDVDMNGKSYEVEAPDMNAATSALQGLAPSPEPSTTGAGIAKSLGSGGVKGLAGLAGLPADAFDLATRGLDYIAGPHADASSFGKTVTDYAGSGAMKGYAERLTGPLYEPKTGIERGVQTIGEFAPAALAGPGGLARRIGTQVLAPAAASEAAGALTEGTALEPYARAAGGVAGAAGASKLARIASRPSAPSLSSQQLAQDVDASYATPAIKATRYNPSAIEAIADNATDLLKKQYFDAERVYKQLDLMKKPMNGSAHSIEDVNNVLKRLREIRGSGGAEGEAARQAIQYISDTLPKVGSLGGIGTITGRGAVAAGDAKAAAADIAAATKNAAGEFRDKALQKIMDDARLSRNPENEIRNGVRRFVKDKSNRASFTLDEWASLEQFAKGSKSSNVIGRISRLFGGGGGLGQYVTGALGANLAGPVGMFGFPAIGVAANKLGEGMAFAGLNKIAAQTRLRTPAGQALPPAQIPPQVSATQNGLLAALLSNRQLLAPLPVANYQGR